MNLIVAVDGDWNIGYKGDLLHKIPADLKQFKEKTQGRVVVMGRKTLASLPGQKPLPNRINVVLTRRVDFERDGFEVCRSLEELFIKLRDYRWEDVFVIGGGQLYNTLLPYCTTAYVTKFHGIYPADTTMANLDKMDHWQLVTQDGPYSHGQVAYEYCLYRNSAVKTVKD